MALNYFDRMDFSNGVVCVLLVIRTVGHKDKAFN